MLISSCRYGSIDRGKWNYRLKLHTNNLSEGRGDVHWRDARQSTAFPTDYTRLPQGRAGNASGMIEHLVIGRWEGYGSSSTMMVR